MMMAVSPSCVLRTVACTCRYTRAQGAATSTSVHISWVTHRSGRMLPVLGILNLHRGDPPLSRRSFSSSSPRQRNGGSRVSRVGSESRTITHASPRETDNDAITTTETSTEDGVYYALAPAVAVFVLSSAFSPDNTQITTLVAASLAAMSDAASYALLIPASEDELTDVGDNVDEDSSDDNINYVIATVVAAIPFVSPLALVALALAETTWRRRTLFAAAGIYTLPLLTAPEGERASLAVLTAVLASLHVQLERVAASRRRFDKNAASVFGPAALIARAGVGAARGAKEIGTIAPKAARKAAELATSEERRQAEEVRRELERIEDAEEAQRLKADLDDFDRRLEEEK